MCGGGWRLGGFDDAGDERDGEAEGEAMIKPWEETWWFDVDHMNVNRPDESDGYYVVACVDEPVDQEAQVARGRLVTCAPEMARMLLRVEWVADGNFASCHFCTGVRPADADFMASRGWRPGQAGFTETTRLFRGHGPDCEWLALMRKAGVR
jgi:hypothetical protein